MKISNFAHQVGPVIYQRGLRYWREGRVEITVEDNDYYRANVHGTSDYTTIVETDGDEITRYQCTCPYNGCCKHVVALLCEIRKKKERFTNADDVTPKETQSVGIKNDALYYLYYLAYSGEKAHVKNDVPPSPSGIRISSSNRPKLLRFLEKEGHIVSLRDFNYAGDCSYRIQSQVYLFVLVSLLTQQPALVAHWRKTLPQTNVARNLTDMAELLCGMQDQLEINYNKTQMTEDGYWRVVWAVRYAEGMDRYVDLLKQLSPSVLEEVLSILMMDAMQDERIELLNMIGEVIDSRTRLTPELERLSCLRKRNYFYFTGEELPLLTYEKEQAGRYYIDATKALYEDHLDDAIKFYQSALKVQNKVMTIKNIPQDSISLLLYTIALALRNTDADKKALQTMQNKMMNSYMKQELVANFALVDYLNNIKDNAISSRLTSIISQKANVSKVQFHIAQLLFAFLVDKETVKNVEPSSFAVLQREIFAVLGGDASPWNYDSVLTKMRIKPAWEICLEELISDVCGAQKENVATSSQERLLYVFNTYSDTLEIREQGRLKSGQWSKGKKLSMRKYRDGDCPMDETDKQLREAWLQGDPYVHRMLWDECFPSLALAIPYLKGTDKLVEEQWYDLTPLSIVEELPYISAKKTGNAIRFQTNVPKDLLEKNVPLLYRKSKNNIVYYPLEKKSRGLFDKILQLKQVPLEAEPMLGQLFQALHGKVEIQSAISGGVQMNQVDGDARLIIQLKPWREMYEANIWVRPLERGTKLYRPGLGDETFLDNREGQRFEVTRNLHCESKNKQILLTILDSYASVIGDFNTSQYLTVMDVIRLLESAPEHADLYAIEWQEGEKLNLKKADASTWQISATYKSGWFELEGDIPITDDHVLNMSQLLNLLHNNEGRYIRLNENEYVVLSELLRRQLDRMDAMAQNKNGKVRMQETLMAVAGDSMHGELMIDEPKQLLAMRKRIRESENLSFAIPDALNATLRDYQEDGYRWMMRLQHWGAGVCLADDMGLGKTVQTIACLLAHADQGAQMVVAPASVVSNWYRELARFAPSLRVTMLNELTIENRAEAICHLGKGDILVATYGLLVSESETLTKRDWVSVCLDEAHTIKNRDTKSSAAAMKLKANNRIILTGTPIQNHLGELWNLIQFINPGILGSYEHFTERFITPIAAGKQDVQQHLKRMIAPFILRRTKQEVARELPDKVEIQVPVQLSQAEMAIYEVLRREAKTELETSSTLNVNTLAMITKLREAACSAALAEKNWTGESSKLEAMIDKLSPMVEAGNRVLIFSQFTSFLKMACETMKKAGMTDYFYLDGSTPIKERQHMVEAFQGGARSVFLISLKAGGLGLNLTGANYVIHLDLWWNPAIEQQATDRAYRIGQQQKVTVYHLISEHTIEEKILRLHESKRSLADSLLQGTDMSHKLTAKDLLELIEC